MTDKLSEASLRLKLRRLYDDSPKAFEDIIGQLQRMAVVYAGRDSGYMPKDKVASCPVWVLPPVKIVRGKPAKLSDGHLARLLAEYKLRDGTREDFIYQTQRRQFGNGYSYGRINVEEHLKSAEKREKSDADFAQCVALFMEMFADEPRWGTSLP
jgi:hypothetical protein